MSLNVTLDRTKLDGGDSRCCNLVVLDGLFGEAERRELVKVALGEDGDKPAEPPSSMWERATADGKDLPLSWGPNSDVLKRLSSGQTPIVCEIWSRLCLMYPEYNICLQPGNDNFIDPRDGQGTEPKHACWPVVGNAPVHGDTFRYHYDGDPASFPNSNWTRQFGRYVNHEPGKPLFVSLLVYLNRFWPKRFLAETLFLDDDTDTGVYVRPKGYRCVLMDQDLMHRISAPSREAPTPRYSIVWKLLFVPKSAGVTPTVARPEWGRPVAFGSTSTASPSAEISSTGSQSAPVSTRQLPPGQVRGDFASPLSVLSQRSSACGWVLSNGDFKVAAARGVSPRLMTFQKTAMAGFLVKDNDFYVDAKYRLLNPIGSGAYGVVCAARDLKTNTKVAIKKISKAFLDLVDAKRILREIKLLRHFSHENVCTLLDLVNPPSREQFHDIYLVMGFMDTDLGRIIRSKNVLSDEHIKYFVYQILRGLKYVHSAHVIHRDLKPGNILVNGNCELRICDFGLARGYTEREELTEYVVTRWYRAPEVMCCSSGYNSKIDVWSLGTIMAELHGREPLFRGANYLQQIELIVKQLGRPTAEDLKFITNENALAFIKNTEAAKGKSFSDIYPNANPLAIDLMSKMLQFNPNKRISVQDALDHKYFEGLRVKDTEVVCDKTFDDEAQKLESIELTEDSVKDAIYNEIRLFRPYLKELRERPQRPPAEQASFAAPGRDKREAASV